MYQALEDGEDIQELAERARDKKDRRAHNKLLKEDASGRNTPASDVIIDGRGRKPKKGKNKANDYEPAIGSKRKRGIKSLSVTPEADDDDDDDHEIVRFANFTVTTCYGKLIIHDLETTKNKDQRK